MILIITNQKDYTTDYLILELKRMNFAYVRFNTEDFPNKVKVKWTIDDNGIDGYFLFRDKTINFRDIRSIWYRRPVAPVVHSDVVEFRSLCVDECKDVLGGILRALDVIWVSHPDRIYAAEYKLNQLKVAHDLGFEIPNSIVTSLPEEAEKFFGKHNKIAIKPIRRGRFLNNDKLKLVYCNLLNKSHMEQVELIKYCPTYFQKYVPKQVEIRATVFGEKVFFVELESQAQTTSEVDWRRAGINVHHSPHNPPNWLSEKCVNLVKTLGLSFGAIDLILTPEGKYVFLEINPNGQWAWMEQLMGMPMRKALISLLTGECNVKVL